MNRAQLRRFISRHGVASVIGGQTFTLADFALIQTAPGLNAAAAEQTILRGLRSIITNDRVKIVNPLGVFDVREDPHTTKVMRILDVGC